MSEHNTLFVTSTPLHVFNAAEMITMKQFGTSDVLIASSMADKYSFLLDCLRAEGAVSKVIEKHYFTTESSNFKTNVRFLLRLVGHRLTHRADGLIQNLSSSGYTDLVLFSPSAVALYVRSLFPNARLHYGEEGIGTYNGNIFDRSFYIGRGNKRTSSKKKTVVSMLNTLMFGGKLSMVPESIYLHEPTLASKDLPAKVAALSGDRVKLREYYIKASENANSEITYSLPIATYLDQPYGRYEDVIARVVAILEKSGLPWVYRKHPRDNSILDVRIPQSNDDIWEMKCLLEINDSSILLSVNSSAMMMPKILTGAEPLLIFLYRLPGIDVAVREASDELVDKLKTLYRNPFRIQIPTSFEELQIALEAFHCPDKKPMRME